MIVTGQSLQMVRHGLRSVITDLRNQIVTCPDEDAHATELRELKKELKRFELFLGRVKSAQRREKQG